jgi:hypothetical protein
MYYMYRVHVWGINRHEPCNRTLTGRIWNTETSRMNLPDTTLIHNSELNSCTTHHNRRGNTIMGEESPDISAV